MKGFRGWSTEKCYRMHQCVLQRPFYCFHRQLQSSMTCVRALAALLRAEVADYLWVEHLRCRFLEARCWCDVALYQYHTGFSTFQRASTGCIWHHMVRSANGLWTALGWMSPNDSTFSLLSKISAVICWSLNSTFAVTHVSLLMQIQHVGVTKVGVELISVSVARVWI